MLRLFKDLKILYLCIAWGGSLVLLAVLSLLQDRYLTGIFLSLAWCIGTSMVFNAIARNRMQKYNDMRMNECRIGEFTQAFEKLSTQKLSPHENSFIKTTLSTGYHDLGQPEKTIALLNEPMEFPQTPNGMISQICCVNNLASSYLQLYHAEGAKPYLDQMKAMLENPNIPLNVKAPYVQLYQDKLQILKMVQGDYTDAQAYFIRYLETHPFRLGQVVGHFYLAKAYIHNGFMEEAKKCLSFVAENGGDTFYAAQAKEIKLGE